MYVYENAQCQLTDMNFCEFNYNVFTDSMNLNKQKHHQTEGESLVGNQYSELGSQTGPPCVQPCSGQRGVWPGVFQLLPVAQKVIWEALSHPGPSRPRWPSPSHHVQCISQDLRDPFGSDLKWLEASGICSQWTPLLSVQHRVPECTAQPLYLVSFLRHLRALVFFTREAPLGMLLCSLRNALSMSNTLLHSQPSVAHVLPLAPTGTQPSDGPASQKQLCPHSPSARWGLDSSSTFSEV